MSATPSAETFQLFATLLRARSGLSIGPDKQYLLEARLAPIIKRERLRDLGALAMRLRATHTEGLAREVVEAMTTNESSFFRDEAPFAHFRDKALPHLLEMRQQGMPIRVWSAAAAAGQEAYSLAMIVAERDLQGRLVEILATDISRHQLARAREGSYSEFEVQRGVSDRMLTRHFSKQASGWRIVPALRRMVQFREWNLLNDPAPLGRFDVVFCRNVLIYFDRQTKVRVLDAIARQMSEGGLLYLGGTETAIGISTFFVPVPEDRTVFARRTS